MSTIQQASTSEERAGTVRRILSLLKQPKTVKLSLLIAVFALAAFVPWSAPRVGSAVNESVMMLSEYARNHILLCLVPAFFIAGAIMVFLNQQSVIKYLGPSAPKAVAYAVASISGTILAVCSCTVLPLFKGIHRKGAGLGPAISFLYSGPAINILAIVLTARVLGFDLGLARAVGAILFAVVIGLIMHLIYRREDSERTTNAAMFTAQAETDTRGVGRTSVYIASMIGILVFVNWAPSGGSLWLWDLIYRYKYVITGLFGLVLAYTLVRWFRGREILDWLRATRDFAIQILPLLFAGVLVAGFLLGRPGHMALIPNRWVAALVGGNSLWANLFASASGALMYFATLTEVPIVQGLVGSGMGQGPALALLLAGPSMSLPSLLVIGGELGWKKTVTYAGLVVSLSTIVGMGYGALVS
ncbi:MAG TPA: permease [Spirochaetia bacterium]|nr:permease [Spirochaetia bacterium]